jgi:uncharacterized protein YyaL (SSP411 family)
MIDLKKNNLAADPSPYLQQHKDNPVNWQVWNKEVLNIAKQNKKPILLSIGYASCHWCHVMAHESFEDKETSKLMNDNFINIKVDREERPDIDFVFQSSFQLFNNSSGGWPLTMFLDENGVPFMAGTYFPKISQHGLPSFKDVLESVHKVYNEQREKILQQSGLITKNLSLGKNPVVKQDLLPFIDSIIINLDEKKGGYKGAPKFPLFNIYQTLLYFYNKSQNEKYLEPVSIILKQLCTRGIYDQVEGGLCRYATDENWTIPHFEKMLYDNAQFISLLCDYFTVTKDKYFLNKISQTVYFIEEQFKNKEDGLLGSAYDADSDGEEGKYYTFNYEEIKNIKSINEYFDIKPEGNWEGKIILEEIRPPNQSILDQLVEIRSKKNKPFFDKKTQLDLNSLWVSSLVKASKVFENKSYLNSAIDYMDKIEKKFSLNDIFHSNFKSIAFIEDYAMLIASLLDLYEATLNIKYKISATQLKDQAIQLFYLKDQNIFQKNKRDSNDIFFKPIDISDHTIPNGNSIMLMNLVRLNEQKYSSSLANSLNGYLNIYRSFMVSSIRAIDFYNENNVYLSKCDTNGCKIT